MRLPLALLACLVPAAAAAAPAAAGEPCGGGRTLAHSAQARAYVRGDTVYACAPGTGRAFRVGAAYGCYGDGCAGHRLVRIAGRYVASAEVSSEGATQDDQFTVRVRDARTGRVVLATTVGAPAGLRASVERLVLDARGHVAFLWTRLGDAGAEVDRELRRSPGCGPAVIASGRDLSPAELTLEAGGAVRWTQAGVPRRAPLCAP